MMRLFFTWQFQREQRRRRRTRHRLRFESRSYGSMGRTPRFEAVEPRLLLTHAAPLLNPVDTPHFNSLQENTPVGSNGGESVINMLQTGGAIVGNQPLGNNFLSYDLNHGAVEGIAILAVTGQANGAWQYSLDSGSSWTQFPTSISAADALVLEPLDLVRYLPDEGFIGGIGLEIDAWDHTDGLSPGGRVDTTLPGATGGGTAYSDTTTSAMIAVTPSTLPSFTLPSSTSTWEDNTVAASGSQHGRNNQLISVPTFVTNVKLGDGGSSAVSFNVGDAEGNFPTLFAQAPAIDSQGTLTYRLNPDVSGLATLNVTAVNGTLVSYAQQTVIAIGQVNDPPTLNPIASPTWVQDTAGQQQITLSGITAGLDETQNLTVTATAAAQNGDNASLIYNLGVSYSNGAGSGTVYYTAAPGQDGTLHVQVTVTDGGGTSNGGINTISQTFVVTVYTAPSFYLYRSSAAAAENAGAQSLGMAAGMAAGTPNGNDPLSFIVSSDSNPGLFSVPPAFDLSGNLTYTPAANQYGQATIGVYLHNGFDGLNSSVATFVVDIVAPPVAYADTYVVNTSGGSSSASGQGVLSNDSDPNSSPQLNASLVSNPSHGSVSFGSDGSYRYYPDGSFQGIDRFNYQAYDYGGPAYGNTATVTLYSHGGALVSNLYQRMLGRAASDSDIATWAPGVDNGSSNMATVDQGLYQSNEYLSPPITGWYQNFLGTSPDPNGLSYWEGIWTSNHGPEQVIVGISSTQQCYDHAGDTWQGWVTLLYEQVLGRQPSGSELSYWSNELYYGYLTRGQVATDFVDGDEYRDDQIRSFFQTFLQRAASSSDVSYYQGLMDNNGYTQLQVQQALVGGSEYTGNPPAPAVGSAYKWV